VLRHGLGELIGVDQVGLHRQHAEEQVAVGIHEEDSDNAR
jgi:hypothetical protein